MDNNSLEVKRQIIEYYKNAIIPCFNERKKLFAECRRHVVERFDTKSSEIQKQVCRLAIQGYGEALMLCFSQTGTYASAIAELEKEYTLASAESEIFEEFKEIFNANHEILSNRGYSFFSIMRDGCSLVKLVDEYSRLKHSAKNKESRIRYGELAKELEKSREKEISNIFSRDNDFIKTFFLNIATYDVIEQARELVYNPIAAFEQEEIDFFANLYIEYKQKHSEFYDNEEKPNKPAKNNTSKNKKDVSPTELEKKSEKDIEHYLQCADAARIGTLLKSLKKPRKKKLYKLNCVFIRLFYEKLDVDSLTDDIVTASDFSERNRFSQLPFEYVLRFVEKNKSNEAVCMVVEEHFVNTLNSHSAENLISILRLIKIINKTEHYLTDLSFITKIGSTKFGLLITNLYYVFGKEAEFFNLLFKALLILSENGVLDEYLEVLAIFSWEENQISKLHEWLIRVNPALAVRFITHVEKRCYTLQNDIARIRENENSIEKALFEQFAEIIVRPITDIEQEIVTASQTGEITLPLQEHLLNAMRDFRGKLDEIGFSTLVDKELLGKIVKFDPQKHSGNKGVLYNVGDRVLVLSLGLNLRKYGDKKWNGKVKRVGDENECLL